MPETARGPRRGLLRLVLVGIAAIVLAGAAWLAMRKERFTPRPAPIADVLQPAPVAVAPGIYHLGNSSPGAVYLVETSEGLVLIDSGIEASAGAVIGQISDLRFELKRLRAILLTHVHADHSLGAARLRNLTGARIYAGRADSQVLRKGGPREAFFSTYHMPEISTHPTTVDVELDGGETITFGETRFVAVATPGHTPGGICYQMERDDVRALFTGDVVQSLSRAHTSTLGTYTAYLPPLYGGNARDYLASLERLKAMPVPDLVLPGH